MVIDARNKLKPEHIKEFLSQAGNGIVIRYEERNGQYDHTLTTTIKEFVDCILNLKELSDDTNIYCSFEDTHVLIISGMDINWWKQNARRYNKLYKVAEEVINAIPAETYKAAIGMLAEKQILQIKVIEGTKSQIIESLNTEIEQRLLYEDIHQTVVINLAYNDDSPNHLDEWLTLQELESIGAVKLA